MKNLKIGESLIVAAKAKISLTKIHNSGIPNKRPNPEQLMWIKDFQGTEVEKQIAYFIAKYNTGQFEGHDKAEFLKRVTRILRDKMLLYASFRSMMKKFLTKYPDLKTAEKNFNTIRHAFLSGITPSESQVWSK